MRPGGGLSRDGLEHFAEVAAGHVGPDKIPGLVALVSRGDEVHVQSLGSLSIGGAPVRRDSLWRIASTTKPVTAAAVMSLVDDTVVRLEDDVERWLPELANRRVLCRMDGPLDDTVAADDAGDDRAGGRSPRRNAGMLRPASTRSTRR